jgi:exopolysaccharide production protein ExoZ
LLFSLFTLTENSTEQLKTFIESNRRRFEWLQVLRALAAFAVFIFHSRELLPARVRESTLFNTVISSGMFGVDLFFVLSGFVVTYALWIDEAPFSIRHFILSRCARIYSGYWLALAALALYLGVFRHLFFDLQFWPALFLLCANIEKNWLFVAWSLTYEVMFYAILGLMFFLVTNKSQRAFVLVLIATIVLVRNLISITLGVPIVETTSLQIFAMLGSGYTLEFMFGALVAVAICEFDVSRTKLIGIAFFLLGGGLWFISKIDVKPESSATRAFTWGILAVGVLVAALYLETRNVRPPNLLIRLGDASFSLYLMHPLLIDIFGNIIAFIPGGQFRFVPSCIFIVAVPICSLFWFVCFEKPLYLKLKRFFRIPK